MKVLSADDRSRPKGKPLETTDRFRFRCHPGIPCFNQCCHNLNLYLYPYDVIRLKNRLEMTSDEFLDRHADMVLRNDSFFPDVLLSMADGKDNPCPFLTPSGCAVYPDRPDACRTFPIEQGAVVDSLTNRMRPVAFFRPPDFCMGPAENTEWTLKTWAADQAALDHNRMTLKWAEVRFLFQQNPWGAEGALGPKAKMAMMATYNMDRFRAFLFASSFFKRFSVKSTQQKKLQTDDTELMLFGFDYVKFLLFGLPTGRFSPR